MQFAPEISCKCLLISFFTRFKLVNLITVYLKITLTKNSYHIATRTGFFMIQVFTEGYLQTGSRTQWVFRCSISILFKVNNKDTTTRPSLLT